MGMAWNAHLSDWISISHCTFCLSFHTLSSFQFQELHCTKLLLTSLQLFLLNVLSNSSFYSNIFFNVLPSVFCLPEIHPYVLTADVSLLTFSEALGIYSLSYFFTEHSMDFLDRGAFNEISDSNNWNQKSCKNFLMLFHKEE